MLKKYLSLVFVFIFFTDSLKAYAEPIKFQSTENNFQSISSSLTEAKSSLENTTKGGKNASKTLLNIINALTDSSSEEASSCQDSINYAYDLLINISENIGDRACKSTKKISKKAKCIPQDVIDTVLPKIENSLSSFENIYNLDEDGNNVSDICEGNESIPTPTSSPESSPSSSASPTPTPTITDVGSCNSNQTIPAIGSLPLDSTSKLGDNLGGYEFYKYLDDYGAVFKIKNNTYIPSEIKVELNSSDSYNINPTIPNPIFIPAMSEVTGFKICATSSSWRYGGYTYTKEFGSSNNVYSGDGKYFLPYKPGETFEVIQGETGTFSHFESNLYALDFYMPEGTEITVSRSGTVIAFKEDSNEGGSDKDTYAKKANYVWILHDDGSFAYYLHLKQNGALVELGQKVNAGDVIGLSGNTGYSTIPHLHFQVVMPRGFAGFDYIPIRFKNINGALVEGNSYTATPVSN